MCESSVNVLWNVHFFRFLSNQVKLEPNESDNADEANVSNASTRKTKKRRTEEKDEKKKRDNGRSAADKNDLGFEPDEILGASDIDGEIKFRIKVKDSDDWEIVRAKKAHAACPELVMNFYEKHIVLNGEPLFQNWIDIFVHVVCTHTKKLWIKSYLIIHIYNQIHNFSKLKFNYCF